MQMIILQRYRRHLQLLRNDELYVPSERCECEYCIDQSVSPIYVSNNKA
jgi:hypothetical protein